MLAAIDEDLKPVALKALNWLAFAGRPLSVWEIEDACIIQPERQPLVDEENRAPIGSTASLLGSLVVISQDERSLGLSEKLERAKNNPVINLPSGKHYSTGGVSPKGTMSFAHFSVKEYLLSDRIAESDAPEFALNELSGQVALVQSSQAYLRHHSNILGDDARKDLMMKRNTHSRDPKMAVSQQPWHRALLETHKILDQLPLMSYAANYWYKHEQSVELNAQFNRLCSVQAADFLESDQVVSDWLCFYDIERQGSVHYARSGPQPLIEDAKNRVIALHAASQLGLPSTVDELCQTGANFNVPDKRGNTPLHTAASCGQLDVANVLIAHNADIDLCNNMQETPLHGAAIKGDVMIAELLLSRGVSFDTGNYHKESPLYYAVKRGALEIVKMLLHRGSDPNNPDDPSHDYGSALTQAIWSRHDDIVELLIEFKADVHGRGQQAWEPYSCSLQP